MALEHELPAWPRAQVADKRRRDEHPLRLAAEKTDGTELQLEFAVARDRGIARDKLTARCLAEFGKKAEYLTRTEASALIEALRKEAA